MKEFFESKKIIQAHEVDFTNRLRIDSLFVLLQDTAAAHADKLNLGFTALIKHDFAWVLSWAKVKVEIFPVFREEIKIKTWPKKKYKLYSLRDFFIYNSEDKIICRATTAWLPINIKTKKIIDTSSLPEPINYQENHSALDEFPQRVFELTEKEFLLKKKMRYTDIDLNQHVNNIKYIELILDSFSVQHYEKQKLEKIEINFVSESKFDDEIEVYTSSRKEKNSSIIEGINKGNSKIAFQAKLNWIS